MFIAFRKETEYIEVADVFSLLQEVSTFSSSKSRCCTQCLCPRYTLPFLGLDFYFLLGYFLARQPIAADMESFSSS